MGKLRLREWDGAQAPVQGCRQELEARFLPWDLSPPPMLAQRSGQWVEWEP